VGWVWSDSGCRSSVTVGVRANVRANPVRPGESFLEPLMRLDSVPGERVGGQHLLVRPGPGESWVW